MALRLAPVTSLNGTWKMQPEKVGLDRPKGDRWCEAPVPMPWTAFYSKTWRVPGPMVPERMAWFRRRVVVPEIPPLSRAVLHFEAVNFYAVVFVNGKRCGEHAGDALPFEVDITDFVTPRHEAEILVGVQDISYAEVRDGGVRRLVYPGLAQHPGIWGGVSLRVLPGLQIAGVSVRTALPGPVTGPLAANEGRMYVTVAIRNETGRAMGFSLTSEVYDGPRQAMAFAPIRGMVGPGERTDIEMTTAWDSAALWWPDQPHLYSLRTALWSALPGSEGTVSDVVDRVHTPVGFRQFRMEGNQFLLNHVPIQLRSESVCPVSGRLFGEMTAGEVPVPVEPEQAREALALLKRERGLNAVRFHRVPPVAALLDAADEVGLLAVVEFPLPDDEGRYAVGSPRFWVNTQELARAWVAARSHHASVVMWSVDRGMVPRYGRGVVEGLRSLVRAVADADPARPVESAGDGMLTDAADEGAAGPLTAFFPPTGVALRTAGRYAAEAVRERVLPGAAAGPSPWLPDRAPGRPLCLMDPARRPLTAAGLAFFLGDGAYGAKPNLAESVAPLAVLETAECRMSDVAWVHTVGRPRRTDAGEDVMGEVVALPQELFGNFYAGTRFVENLVLRNDTRFDQDCDLVCRLTTEDGEVHEHSEELLLGAGTQERKAAAFELPDIRKVLEAGAAGSVLAEFSVDFTGNRAGAYHSRRKIAVWPHVRAMGARRIGLYDPDGRTASALMAVGARTAAAREVSRDEFDTVMIGEGALSGGSALDAGALRAFVADGGLAVFLAQRTMPYDFSPVTLLVDEGRDAAITFVRDGEHRLLQGLSSFEMRWWQEDHRVAACCFRKPSRGNFRCLVDAGGPGGLRWAAAVEVFHGQGSYLFSQMELVEKAARVPIAGLLLARLADAVPAWRAVPARAVEGDDVFARVGVSEPPLPAGFGSEALARTQVLLLTGAALGRLSAGQVRAVRHWLEHGGCLYLHNVVPGQEKCLAALAAQDVRIHGEEREQVVFNAPGAGLARGLSSADVDYRDHGARCAGTGPRRIPAATATLRVKGDVAAVAAAAEDPLDLALATLHAGKGRIVIDQVRWDSETEWDSRAGRYVSTLLTNLGVALAPGGDAAPSARCRLVDMSGVCNATLASFLPGEAGGWTGRGPDGDLSALRPGVIIAGGLPFRVGKVGAADAPAACVLSGAGSGAAGPIAVGARAAVLGFLVACEGAARRGVPVAQFTVRYDDGLETQVPLRYGIDVLDWNERARRLEGGDVGWRGFTAVGEPAVVYVKKWSNSRSAVGVSAVTFSTTRAGAVPILLGVTARA